MLIYLYNDHTAVAVDDRSGAARTVPQALGILSIGGETVQIGAEGGAIPRVKDGGSCFIHGSFLTASGIRYTLERLHLNINNVPVSKVDDRGMMLEIRQKQDAIERVLDELTKAVHDLKGIYDKDALWFLRKEDVPKDNTQEENI